MKNYFMFQNRKEAGQLLGTALGKYEKCGGIVLAIPRGGVEVGYYVARRLELPMSVIGVRKLPFPDNPEAGFGAIAEDGSIYLADRTFPGLSSRTIEKITTEQTQEMKRRIQVFRAGKPLASIAGKIVIVVDDGVAMGSTMQAAIMLCRNQQAKKIVAAAPVAGRQTAAQLAKVADEAVILETPAYFQAVAQVYKIWYDVSDNEVLGFIQKMETPQPGEKNPGIKKIMKEDNQKLHRPAKMQEMLQSERRNDF